MDSNTWKTGGIGLTWLNASFQYLPDNKSFDGLDEGMFALIDSMIETFILKFYESQIIKIKEQFQTFLLLEDFLACLKSSLKNQIEQLEMKIYVCM